MVFPKFLLTSLATFQLSFTWCNIVRGTPSDDARIESHSVASSIQETKSNPRDKEFESGFDYYMDNVYCDFAGIETEHRLRIMNIIQSYSAKFKIVAEQDKRKPVKERLHYQCLIAIEETCTREQLAAMQYLRICVGFQYPGIKVARDRAYSSEFNFSEEQAAGLDKIAKEWIAAIVGECVPVDKQSQLLSYEELSPIYQAINKTSENEVLVNRFRGQVAAVMTEAQQERLQELEFQWRLIRHGPKSFVDPVIAARLELSEIQLDFISGLPSVSREWVNREQLSGDVSKLVEQLSADQLKSCSRLLGTIHAWNEGMDSMGWLGRFKNTP
jgi:hypothetical protein